MADEKKNIPDAGKGGEPRKQGKTEPVKTDPPAQDYPVPAKAEVLRWSSRLRRVRRLPKTRTLLLRLKRACRQARRGSRSRASAWEILPQQERRWILPLSRLERQRASPSDKGKQAEKVLDAAKPCRGRTSKADKATPDKAKPQPRDKMSRGLYLFPLSRP